MAAPGFTLVDYSWNFGDGSPVVSGEEQKVPTHIYAVNGTYIVSLTVTDRTGLTATTSQSIDVKPAPIVDSINFKRNMKASQSLTQTWTVNLINPNAFPIYAKVEITGTGDTIGAFTVMSGPVLLPVGSGTTAITLSKTFTSFDVGLTWNFQVKVTFSGNGIAGTYELGAIQTDYFRIRP
jgi:PKD repeat protein